MIKFVEELVVTTTGKPLSFIQKVILQETLARSSKTYTQIAQENNYAETYIKLKSLGVIRLSRGKAYISCRLYQNYFINWLTNHSADEF